MPQHTVGKMPLGEKLGGLTTINGLVKRKNESVPYYVAREKLKQPLIRKPQV